MASTTKKLLRAGAWVELTAGAVPTTFVFDNHGPASILVQYVDAEPAAGADGVLFKPGQGDRPVSVATKVWARVELANSVAGSDASVYVETT